MELKQYWNLILKNLSAIIVLSILGASVGVAVSLISPKSYTAESQIFISTPTPVVDITALQQGSSFAQQRVISYARVITGPTTLEPVIDKLNLDLTSSQLASKIVSSAPLGTVLINIKVSDVSGVRAAAIANAVAVQFGETVKTLELPQYGESSGVKSTLVRTAEIPASPSSPNTKFLILTGFLFGFATGCLVGIVRQIFDSTVKNANHLSGRPLLSTILFDPDAKENPLLTQIGNYSIRAESFRHLRTALKFPNVGNECEVIAVTSAFPGEGKTTTSINLAITYAQTGMKVALVEADLRRPSFKKYFASDEDHTLGLIEVLNLIESGKSPKRYEDLFQTFGDAETCFEWLASGAIPPNPAEKLDSPSMNEFIERLKLEYDIVIFDTPPALPVTDAAILSTKVDSVIVVARAGVTKQSHVGGVFDILDNVKAQTLGVVLNMVPQHARGEEYGYAYNRYAPKSKYGYKYGNGYGYGTSEPYGPLVFQSNLPSTGEMRVPLEVRLKAKLTNRKKVKAVKVVDEVTPVISQTQVDSEFEKLLAEIKKK